ncbi:MAG: Fic family protein [Gammaproteobacteria bacterium]|nr:Fic family protein [Gammaproteobacteria bacterium]
MKSKVPLPETLVSDTGTTRAVSRAVNAGRLRKLASRLYSSNLHDSPEAIVARNLWDIVAGYFPGALIADRTAFENAPASDGSVCLITPRGRDIDLPGVKLRPRRGHGPLPDDKPFLGNLFLCSSPRAYLENMRPSRARDGRLARTLSLAEIEARLDSLIRLAGEQAINRLRDEIRALAPSLDLEREAVKLDTLIGRLLGTREAALISPSDIARASGRPYDPQRIALFQALQQALDLYPPVSRISPHLHFDGDATLAFFEAYFSNFIEGTEFAVDEAADIVFHGAMPQERPSDAHDILGTWRLVSSEQAMSQIPTGFEQFLRLLKARHESIMAGRPEAGPGLFKQTPNRAGGTLFVAPELVPGTLERGFDLYRRLTTPFARAVYMMFLVLEVHPFADGNGRVARVMMNAELVAAGEQRIIIPTVLRDNYMAALKSLSQAGEPAPLIRVLDYAQRWTLSIPWRSVEATKTELDACHAFMDPFEAESQGLRLRMPESFT